MPFRAEYWSTHVSDGKGNGMDVPVELICSGFIQVVCDVVVLIFQELISHGIVKLNNAILKPIFKILETYSNIGYNLEKK